MEIVDFQLKRPSLATSQVTLAHVVDCWLASFSKIMKLIKTINILSIEVKIYRPLEAIRGTDIWSKISIKLILDSQITLAFLSAFSDFTWATVFLCFWTALEVLLQLLWVSSSSFLWLFLRMSPTVSTKIIWNVKQLKRGNMLQNYFMLCICIVEKIKSSI